MIWIEGKSVTVRQLTNSWLSAMCAATMILYAGSLAAQTNLIGNGSFESPTNDASAWVVAAGYPYAIAGWKVTVGDSMVIRDTDAWVLTPAKDGHQFWLPCLSPAGMSVSGKIQQTFATESGKTYDVSFYYAFLDATHYGLGKVTAYLTYDVGGTPTRLAIAADTPWTKETFQFTATGVTTTLTFSGGASVGTAYPGPGVDVVVVTKHDTLEPGTTVLFLSDAAVQVPPKQHETKNTGGTKTRHDL